MSSQTPTRIEPSRLRIGTRASPLAMRQAEEARQRICRANRLDRDRVELYPIATTGDRRTDRPLADLGGKGLFAREIDSALLDGQIDLAIHSAKDLPGLLPEGLTIAAVLPRQDPRDCLVSGCARTIPELPLGATVGTCSPRRQAQLLHVRPDLSVVPLRGNVGTRLAAVAAGGPLDATLLASAGLRRMGIQGERIHPVAVDELLPALGQGAVAIVVRKGDPDRRRLAERAGDPPSARALDAERGLLGALVGDCHTPIAGLATERAGRIRLVGEILTRDGSRRIRREREGPTSDPSGIGERLAGELLAVAGPGFWESGS